MVQHPTEVYGRRIHHCDRSTSCQVHSLNVCWIELYRQYAHQFLLSDDEKAWLIVCGNISEPTGPPSSISAGKIRVENSHFRDHPGLAINRLKSLHVQGLSTAESTQVSEQRLVDPTSSKHPGPFPWRSVSYTSTTIPILLLADRLTGVKVDGNSTAKNYVSPAETHRTSNEERLRDSCYDP